MGNNRLQFPSSINSKSLKFSSPVRNERSSPYLYILNSSKFESPDMSERSLTVQNVSMESFSSLVRFTKKEVSPKPYKNESKVSSLRFTNFARNFRLSLPRIVMEYQAFQVWHRRQWLKICHLVASNLEILSFFRFLCPVKASKPVMPRKKWWSISYFLRQ